MDTKTKDSYEDFLQLPSKVTDKKFIRMPPVEKVVKDDDEWMKCGKWIIPGFKSVFHQDKLWTKLQNLVENGTLLMIKSSTAAFVVGEGIIICYTRPGKSHIKQVAESIQSITNHDCIMFYKSNEYSGPYKTTKSTTYYAYQYMCTPMGRFYESKDMQWILATEVEACKETRKIKRSSLGAPSLEIPLLSDYIDLMVDEEKLKLTHPDFQFFKDFWELKCSISHQGAATTMKTLRNAANDLFLKGVFPRITGYKTKFNVYSFRFYVVECDEAEKEILKHAIELRKTLFFPHPIYFHANDCIKFMNTAENECFKAIIYTGTGFLTVWKAIEIEE